jgi:mannosyl-oligosaccharide alpha-1,2-mannosidase
MFFRRYKWPLFIVAAIIFLATVSPLSARFAPSTVHDIFPITDHKHPASQTAPPISLAPSASGCPTAPPHTALVPDTQGRFDWRTVPRHHPVEQFAQLPQDKPTLKRTVQHKFGTTTTDARREAVRDVFKRCWGSYKDRAWTKDELAPISGGVQRLLTVSIHFGSWT